MIRVGEIVVLNHIDWFEEDARKTIDDEENMFSKDKWVPCGTLYDMFTWHFELTL